MTAAAVTGTISSRSASRTVNKLLVVRLYRNLLRAAKPFSAPSPIAPILGCLLHRTGIDDHIRDWDAYIKGTLRGSSSSSNVADSDAAATTRTPEEARNLTISYMSAPGNDQRSASSSSTTATKTDPASSHRTTTRLFRRLLREVVTGTDGYAKMTFPSQLDTERLQRVVRREFRAAGSSFDDSNVSNGSPSTFFDETARLRVAMVALRELHKKLSYYDTLKENAPAPVLHQAASNVSSLPMSPPSSFLRPGVFLVSHPLLNDGFFSKTVICILKHQALDDDGTGSSIDSEQSRDEANTNVTGSEESIPASSSSITSSSDDIHDDNENPDGGYNLPGQTYGVIVNRVSMNHETGRQRTLREAFQDHMLPARLAEVFGSVAVREGGPVHVALQMIHSLPSSPTDPVEPTPETSTSSSSSSTPHELIGGSLIAEITDDDQHSTALYSDRATYFRGNMFKAMDAVNDGSLDRNDISFYVGASTWAPGQLASEIAQGFWRPMRGSPEMALHGICEHEQLQTNGRTNNSSASTTRVLTNGQSDDNKDTTDNIIPTGGTSTSAAIKNKRPLADLWLSMMSAVGPDDAELAHLFHHEAWDECGLPCDSFIEEDDLDDDPDIIIL